MTNLVDRPSSPRGDRRREQLVEAGVDLLCENGWPAVTTRAVAERAGTNPGLIHYHFGGLPGLHAAIAGRAGDLVIGPVVSTFADALDQGVAVATMRALLPHTTDDERAMRLAVELIAGATRDPALGEVLKDQLRQVRTEFAQRLRRLHPTWPARRPDGVATLVTALIDGLVLHYMVDPALPLDDAFAVLRDLLEES
ncbi:TetR/AcrR family transcriptional regulator [Nonomuraea sp. NPDC050536]|uniref:TetR/AcrR family transcriptional regulator n=1 Tax=Nonomuraea sp. NPDC050536 TaxID=3364366 RepID=UPI0037C9232F